MANNVQDMIVTQALLDLGEVQPGEAPNTTESDNAFAKLNQIISSLSLEFTAYTHAVASYILFAGLNAYTMGPGGTLPTASRPVKIKGATCSYQGFQRGVQVMPMGAFESSIANELGIVASLISKLGEDAAGNQKNLRVWPTPAVGCSLELSFWTALPPFAALTDVLNFPVPGYELALVGELALALAPAYGRVVSAELQANYARAKQRLVDINGLIEMGPPAAAA